MDEDKLQNPNTTLNGYIMEFWKFDLTWKLKCPIQQKYTKKNREKPQKKEEYPQPLWTKSQSTTQPINPRGDPTKC